MASNPFAKLMRDLPKGGKAMKVAAEQVPSKAEQAVVSGMKNQGTKKMLKRAAIGAGMGLGTGIALDMMTSSEDAGDARADKTMAERAKYGDVAKKLPGNLPANLKGSPKMIDMEDSPSYIPRPQSQKPEEVAHGFLKEMKRNIPAKDRAVDLKDGFTPKKSPVYEEDVDVEVRNPMGEVKERYGANLKSNKPIDEMTRRKSVGVHQVLKNEPGVKKPYKGAIEFDDEEE